MTVKIVPHRKFKLSGATLVEMVAAIIILGLVVIGVAQFLLVSKINVYTDNVRTGVLQALSDTIVKYQTMNVGETNVPVDGCPLLWASGTRDQKLSLSGDTVLDEYRHRYVGEPRPAH